jgi:uncharacterized protein (TIGR03086 family)
MTAFRVHGAPMTNTATSTPTSDRRAALVAAYDHAAQVVAAVRPDQLAGPTPCPDYDVATLVDHLVGAGWRTVELGRGHTPTGAEFPHVDLAEAPGQLRKAGGEAATAWTADRLTATTTMPWGQTYNGFTLVDMYLSELMAHAWDLAVATGHRPSCDQDLAAAALTAAHAMLRPEYRDMMGVGNPFGAEQPAGDGASTLERFAAFMGRPLDWRPE